MFRKEKDKPLLKRVDPFKKKKKGRLLVTGSVSGLFNGLFGSGGGVLAVMFLRGITEDERKAHASATLMMLIMSLVSLGLYAFNGDVDYHQGLLFMPGGVIGAVAGAIFLKKLNSQNLRRIFGAVLAISGLVMLFR